MTAPADLLARWHLAAPRLVASTPRATVWQVTRPDGQSAALKILRPGEMEKARGFRTLAALDGRGAVRVLAQAEDAILMEWCDGSSLGDLSRSGQDDAATTALCTVIRTLHTAPCDPAGLWPLAATFAPLTAPALDGDLATAARIARACLADPRPTQALHGDLHHDNVLSTPRGWLAIDPKGLCGDPA
jgi:streptomycin 6-kinase